AQIVRAFLKQNAIALAALFVALGGTGYAAVTINGSSIKNGSIAGKKLKKHTLHGTQINVKKLGTVPAAKKASSATSATSATTAATATNATELGGHPASAYLTTGCQNGTVEGYATINGRSTLPSTYTTSSSWLPSAFDCSGQAVQVRRSSAGVYDIQFPGVSAQIGIASPEYCTLGEGPACLAYPALSVGVTPILHGPDTG